VTDAARTGIRLLLALTLITAAAVRFWGISSGVDANLYVNDEIFEVHRALGLLRGDPESIPGAKGFYFLILAVEYAVWGAVSVLLGWSESFAGFISHTLAFPGLAVLLGRITSAVLGTVSVLFLYLAGRRAFEGRGPALALAVAWALSPLSAWISHWAFIETTLATAGILALWSCLGVLKTRRRRDYVLSAVFIAVAAACKTYGISLLLVLWTAHFLSTEETVTARVLLRRARDARIWTHTAAALTLWIMLAPRMAIHGLSALGLLESSVSFLPPSDLPPNQGLDLYLRYQRWNLGNITLLFFAAGVIATLRDRHRPTLICIVFATVFTLTIGLIRTPTLIYPRYILVTLPFLFCVSVHGALALARLAPPIRRIPPARWRALALSTLIMLGAWNGIESMQQRKLYTTRFRPVEAVAMSWIEENIPAGSTILLKSKVVWPGHQTLPLRDLAENYRLRYRQSADAQPALRFRPVLLDLAEQPAAPRYDLRTVSTRSRWRTVAEYQALGVRYVIADSSGYESNFVSGAASGRAFRSELDSSDAVRLIRSFEGGFTLQGNPREIFVYEILDPPSKSAVSSARH